MDSEYNPEISYTYPQTEKPFRINHNIKKPDFFLIDKISNEYINNHKNFICFL